MRRKLESIPTSCRSWRVSERSAERDGHAPRGGARRCVGRLDRPTARICAPLGRCTTRVRARICLQTLSSREVAVRTGRWNLLLAAGPSPEDPSP